VCVCVFVICVCVCVYGADRRPPPLTFMRRAKKRECVAATAVVARAWVVVLMHRGACGNALVAVVGGARRVGARREEGATCATTAFGTCARARRARDQTTTGQYNRGAIDSEQGARVVGGGRPERILVVQVGIRCTQTDVLP